MAGLFASLAGFGFAAAVAGVPASEPPRSGAQVRAAATVVILRSETASEKAGPEGLARHVSRRSDGTTTIVFE